jgi:hypothetical protein
MTGDYRCAHRPWEAAVRTAQLVRFSVQYAAAVWAPSELLRGAYIVVRDFGWLFGSAGEALAEARWLARSLGLPVRNVAS